MRALVHTLHLLALAAALLATSLPALAEEPIKVVYHLNTGLEQASDALRNIRNHLSTDPKVKIAVVTHARGIDFLLAGAEDKDKNPYHVIVEDLVSQGVEFKVCNITLERRKIDRSKVIPEAKVVPSGVGEVSRLQAREGYAYLKP
jgi:intracellular sulfur oxidation DsrE/DsrF family protein